MCTSLVSAPLLCAGPSWLALFHVHWLAWGPMAIMASERSAAGLKALCMWQGVVGVTGRGATRARSAGDWSQLQLQGPQVFCWVHRPPCSACYGPGLWCGCCLVALLVCGSGQGSMRASCPIAEGHQAPEGAHHVTVRAAIRAWSAGHWSPGSPWLGAQLVPCSACYRLPATGLVHGCCLVALLRNSWLGRKSR